MRAPKEQWFMANTIAPTLGHRRRSSRSRGSSFRFLDNSGFLHLLSIAATVHTAAFRFAAFRIVHANSHGLTPMAVKNTAIELNHWDNDFTNGWRQARSLRPL